MKKKSIAIIILVCLFSCSPHVVQNGAQTNVPVLSKKEIITQDGYKLPLLQQTINPTAPKAIVLALHGMNDYSKAFHTLGEYLASKNIKLVAYDQRGFGKTEKRGYWHGIDALTNDLAAACLLVKKQNPGVPVFLLGDSMGGAVVLSALEILEGKIEYQGIILIAPAVWAKETMPWYQSFFLWFFANTVPSLILTADGLDITPSDNKQMLRDLGKDPFVIKGTRVDTLYGLSNLMDKALYSSEKLTSPTLLLYGERDEVIPKEPICELMKKLQKNKNFDLRFILYPDGYHMLTRDLRAGNVFQDIEKWIKDVLSDKGCTCHGIELEDLKSVCRF